jgi:hypothetical protein
MMTQSLTKIQQCQIKLQKQSKTFAINQYATHSRMHICRTSDAKRSAPTNTRSTESYTGKLRHEGHERTRSPTMSLNVKDQILQVYMRKHNQKASQ